MPVSYSSPARNLFLLGTTGQDVVTNFFDKIDRSSSGYFSFLPVEVIKNNVVGPIKFDLINLKAMLDSDEFINKIVSALRARNEKAHSEETGE